MEQETYSINRIELRRLLISFGVNEKNIAILLSTMEKMHRHVNIISFVAMLEKINIPREKMVNIFRRFGIDDVTINGVLNAVDEEKIKAETGRLYEVSLS